MPNNKLGIFSWFGFVLPLPQRLEMIKQAGFDATTIWWEDEVGSPEIKKEDMPGIVRDCGLILENIHVPYDNVDHLWCESKSLRGRIVDRHIQWLNDCAFLGIPVMLMHIIDRHYPPTPKQWGIDGIGRLLRTAEDLGVKIALENTGSVEYIDFVLNELLSDHLLFCYDSSHDYLYSAQKAAILKKQGPRLQHLHLSDNDLKMDRHWLPGEGQIDWQQLSHYFPRDSYEGNITLEVCPGDEDLRKTPRQFIDKAHGRALWLRSLLISQGDNSKHQTSGLVDTPDQ